MVRRSDSNFKTVPISSLYVGLFDGPHATPAPSETGPIFLGIKNITEDGYIDLTNTRCISDQEYARWTKRVVPRENDIVFSYEATLHRYAIIPSGFHGCLGRRMALIRPDLSKVEPRYLFYFFRSPLWRRTVETKIIAGATVDRIPLITFPDFAVTIPDLDSQRRIVSILSAYDDLIENNKRRIAILEKMAEEIYREWFVRMRFSASAKATAGKSAFLNSYNVLSPGRREPISHLVRFQSGYSFKSQDYSPSGRFGIVTIKNVHDGLYIQDCSDYIEEPPSNMKKYCYLQDGDILMSLTGNVGRVCRVHGTGNLLNQRVAKLAPVIEGTEDFVYWFFRNSSIQTLCELISTGAAQQNLSPIKLGVQLVPLPSAEQIKQFCSVVKSTSDLISNLLKQNQNLTLSRDLLLPRLISGKLSVDNISLDPMETVELIAAEQQGAIHA